MSYPNRRGGGEGIPGPAGANGVGISSSTIGYQVSSSPTNPPTEWHSSPTEVPKGSYLWTKVGMNYTNNTSSTAYAVAYAGSDGTPGAAGKDGANGKDGKGISSAVVEYQLSSSGYSPPSGAWSTTLPSANKGQYLWVRTTINYSDSTSTSAYSVSYLGADGVPGQPGQPGKDGVNGTNGVGVSSSAVTYQVAASGASVPVGTWSSTLPSPVKGQYLWSRAVISYTDGSSTTVYSVSYQGNDGSPGQKGDPGAAGSAGVSFSPQTPTSRAVTIGTPYQHTDTTKPFKCVVNARATQTLTVAGLSADKLELRAGPNAAAVAAGGSGGFSLAVWESGITGIALMIGAGIQDGGQMICDIPAGWYFQINRLSGTSATVVSCFTQSLTA